MQNQHPFKVFPVSTKGLLYVSWDDLCQFDGEMTIYNIHGSTIAEKHFKTGDSDFEIDMSLQNAGMYAYPIEYNGKKYQGKFQKI